MAERIALQSRSTSEMALTIRAAENDVCDTVTSATEVEEAAEASNAGATDVLRLAREMDSEAKRIQSQIEDFFRNIDLHRAAPDAMAAPAPDPSRDPVLTRSVVPAPGRLARG